jgi:pyruvate, orthophosphate dikinase
MTYMRDDQSGPPELDAQVAEALGRLERQAGKRLGDPEDPLLLAVRRGGRSRGRAICPGG